MNTHVSSDTSSIELYDAQCIFDGQTSTNHTVFDTMCQQYLDQIKTAELGQQNGTSSDVSYHPLFITFGQTNSGKTHSIIGNVDDMDDEPLTGILVQFVSKIFAFFESTHSKCRISICGLEEYGESLKTLKLYDLFAKFKSNKRSALEQAVGSPPALSTKHAQPTFVNIESVDHLEKLMADGCESIHCGLFDNKIVSCGHCLFQINVNDKYTLSFFDMAGYHPSYKLNDNGIASNLTLNQFRQILCHHQQSGSSPQTATLHPESLNVNKLSTPTIGLVPHFQRALSSSNDINCLLHISDHIQHIQHTLNTLEIARMFPTVPHSPAKVPTKVIVPRSDESDPSTSVRKQSALESMVEITGKPNITTTHRTATAKINIVAPPLQLSPPLQPRESQNVPVDCVHGDDQMSQLISGLSSFDLDAERIPNERIPNEVVPTEQVPNGQVDHEQIPNDQVDSHQIAPRYQSQISPPRFGKKKNETFYSPPQRIRIRSSHRASSVLLDNVKKNIKRVPIESRRMVSSMPLEILQLKRSKNDPTRQCLVPLGFSTYESFVVQRKSLSDRYLELHLKTNKSKYYIVIDDICEFKEWMYLELGIEDKSTSSSTSESLSRCEDSNEFQFMTSRMIGNETLVFGDQQIESKLENGYKMEESSSTFRCYSPWMVLSVIFNLLALVMLCSLPDFDFEIGFVRGIEHQMQGLTAFVGAVEEKVQEALDRHYQHQYRSEDIATLYGELDALSAHCQAYASSQEKVGGKSDGLLEFCEGILNAHRTCPIDLMSIDL